MAVLDDKALRPLAQKWLNSVREDRDSPVLHELWVANRNARFDLWMIDRQRAWGLEIKGETDKRDRLTLQVPYYDAYSHCRVLLTTENHWPLSMQHIPPEWTVLVAHGIHSHELEVVQTTTPRVHIPDGDALWRLLRKTEVMALLEYVGLRADPGLPIDELRFQLQAAEGVPKDGHSVYRWVRRELMDRVVREPQWAALHIRVAG